MFLTLFVAAVFYLDCGPFQTWTAGMTLPSGRYLEHPPQYFPPSPPFPLTNELAAQERIAGEVAPGFPAGPLAPRIPGAPPAQPLP